MFMLNSRAMRPKKKRILQLAIICSAVCLYACGGYVEPTANGNANLVRKGSPLPKATVDEFASGKNVYESSCMICHSANGTGGRVSIEGKNLNVEDLTADKIKKMSDERIITYIMNGVEEEGMPAFKGRLSEGEMRDVVVYMRKQFHGQ